MWNRFGQIAWWLLVGAAWAGCGPSVDLELPNGYSAVVTSACDSSIQWPDDIEYGSTVVGGWENWIDGLDVQGNLLIGRLVDSSDCSGQDEWEWPLEYFFVLDTSTHTLMKFDTEEEWLDGVEMAGGSRELNTRRITPFFYSGQGWIHWIQKIVVYGVGSLFVVWIVRRFRKAKRGIESDGIGLI